MQFTITTMSKIIVQQSEKRRYQVTVRNEQDETERVLRFPSNFWNIFGRKRYICLKKLTFEYIPIIQQEDIGCLEIRIIDSRRPSTAESRIITIRLYANEYQVVNVQDLEWALRKDTCPWKIEILAKIKGMEVHVAVGDLKITPYFCYTNSKPNKKTSSVNLSKNDPKLSLYKVPSALVHKFDSKNVYLVKSPLMSDLYEA